MVTMTLVAFVLICVAVMLLGGQSPKPINYVVIGLAVLALLVVVAPTLFD